MKIEFLAKLQLITVMCSWYVDAACLCVIVTAAFNGKTRLGNQSASTTIFDLGSNMQEIFTSSNIGNAYFNLEPFYSLNNSRITPDFGVYQRPGRETEHSIPM